ncbi:hypothetical protein PCIT_a2715 [Pseudoalteromonas citrea]|uniref:DUF3080 domain-containing protein n=2 Tax=Pseudoalteromonas citrea TaxID=43655 RepID=A0AAD4FRH9_9GAMM|nr:DUF3080 family protein [Pseudoalteromonas citrea]KAF7769811.1 hypothetical protein PCIT_a2715 [Pseudoalteromonas citrea]
MLKLVLLSITILCIVGCSKQPTDTYIEYQSRLSSLLETAGPDNTEIEKLFRPYVEKPTSQVSLSIIEFAKINHCKLSQIIAKKNNQLGKVQLPSEALKYNIEFIQQAQKCIDDPLTDANTIEGKLIAVKIEKQQQLVQSFEHMLFKEAELAKLTHLTANEITFDRHREQQTASLEALTQLSNLQRQIQNKAELEQVIASDITLALQKLHKNSFIPKLVTSAQYQIALNNSTTHWLNKIDIENELCPTGKNKQKAKIFSNIFAKFYLKTLQPYQSKLTNMLEQTSPLLVKLWQNHPVLAERFNPEHNLALLNQIKASAILHVKWWQSFYKTCEIRPQ